MQWIGHARGLSKNVPLAKQIPEEVGLVHRPNQRSHQSLGVDSDAIHVRGDAVQRKRSVWSREGEAREIIRGEGLFGEPSLTVGTG